ncbi:RNA-binding protein 28 [Chamberlinius hualienensis]
MDKKLHSNTLFVGGLPATATNAELEELFGEIGPLKRCFVVKGKCIGYVTYAFKDDTDEAIAKIKSFNGKILNVKIANKKPTEKEVRKKQKKGVVGVVSTVKPADVKNGKIRKIKMKKRPNQETRLIVRNLPFKAEKDDILNMFSKFGNVVEVSIPKKSDGRKLGFGFVQFENLHEAIEAINVLNATKLMDRPIAVDHAIPLNEYKDLKKVQSREEESDDDETSNEDDDEVEESETEKSPVERNDNKNCLKDVTDFPSDDENAPPKDLADLIASDSDDSEKDDNEEYVEEGDEEDDDDDDDDGEEDEDDDKPSKNHNLKLRNRKSDVDEGKTLFIRNLNFTTTNEKLNEVFSQFGQLEYAVICVDPVTVHSKGSGFVKFKNKADAERCMELVNDAPKDGVGITIDDFKVTVGSAVSRFDLKKQKEKEVLDKKKCHRNLYLAREGMIRAGTKAAEGVSQQDLAKRMQIEIWKRQMLQNLHVFVSKTRLCVRNLPPHVTNEKLRKTFKEAAGKGAEVIEARVMRYLQVNGDDGYGLSKGYGFVNFTTHETALKALRNVNNNPNIFTAVARPIVEFSLENKAALKAKQKRLEKSTTVKKNADKSDKRPNDDYNNDEEDDEVEFAGVKSDETRFRKGLPSHMGPKIRHGKISRNFLKKQKKMNKISRKQRREKMYKAGSQNKTRNSNVGDHFEFLRKRRSNSTKHPANKKAKWYA